MGLGHDVTKSWLSCLIYLQPVDKQIFKVIKSTLYPKLGDHNQSFGGRWSGSCVFGGGFGCRFVTCCLCAGVFVRVTARGLGVGMFTALLFATSTECGSQKR